MASIISFVDLLQPLAAPTLPSLRGRGEEALPAPNSRGADLLREAEAEAARILAQARAEADEIMADAEIQAEALREAAWQEGRFQGEQAGRAAAEAKVQSEGETQRGALRAQWDALLDDISEARQVLWQTQEQEMLALTLAIARQVIKAEVTQNPEVVRQVIANAVRRVVDKEMVRIRVCAGEAGRVREMRQDLIETLDGLHH
ncbi:MAG: FliH/SctL family protein, partial [Armatimonadota bacterium]|nr:FliH/SctL family protein [Armatimonadota bacterium]